MSRRCAAIEEFDVARDRVLETLDRAWREIENDRHGELAILHFAKLATDFAVALTEARDDENEIHNK
jgi:hypothetical protein